MTRLILCCLAISVASPAMATEILPKSVGPMYLYADDCPCCTCDRYSVWRQAWAVFHPTKLAAENREPVALPGTWVVKHTTRQCCRRQRYHAYVTEGGSIRYAATARTYKARPDSPRIPPVLPAYWADGTVPDWLIAGEYIFFVRVDPADAAQRSSWWISANGKNWQFLQGESLVENPTEQPPTHPLPPIQGTGL